MKAHRASYQYMIWPIFSLQLRSINGFCKFVSAIMRETVGRGTERIRCISSTDHTLSQTQVFKSRARHVRGSLGLGSAASLQRKVRAPNPDVAECYRIHVIRITHVVLYHLLPDITTTTEFTDKNESRRQRDRAVHDGGAGRVHQDHDVHHGHDVHQDHDVHHVHDVHQDHDDHHDHDVHQDNDVHQDHDVHHDHDVHQKEPGRTSSITLYNGVMGVMRASQKPQ
ncbi:hypothetical protein FOCC_FOCC002153 [Frankliniella occidentalis]|nr:hypothetical protein FOCC_FOCC002153 [Frankliniella occidentalis]